MSMHIMIHSAWSANWLEMYRSKEGFDPFVCSDLDGHGKQFVLAGGFRYMRALFNSCSIVGLVGVVVPWRHVVGRHRKDSDHRTIDKHTPDLSAYWHASVKWAGRDDGWFDRFDAKPESTATGQHQCRPIGRRVSNMPTMEAVWTRQSRYSLCSINTNLMIIPATEI